MKIVYEAANSLDAHVVQDVLRQHHIAAIVLGEHLQGAIGDLQAANLVRVEVPDDDASRARQIVMDWDRSNPGDGGSGGFRQHQTAQSVHGVSVSWLLVAMLVGMIIGYSLHG